MHQREVIYRHIGNHDYLRQLDHDRSEDDAESEALCKRHLQAVGVVQQTTLDDE